MSPSAVTNQCVAGALATWALMHGGDPRWNHPPPLLGNAIDYEVVEQNYLDFSPAIEPHWATVDLRSVAWPDPAVVESVVEPC
jgi:hypothetical protein